MESNHRKIAVVTGGSRGLGRNAALHLARKGVDIILTYRSQRAEAEQVVADIAAQGGRAVARSLTLPVRPAGARCVS